MKTLGNISSADDSAVSGLPDSFARMVMSGGAELTPDELVEKYNLPYAFTELYLMFGEQFLLYRRIRNGIYHHGKDAGYVFPTEIGYAVRVDQEPWCDLSIWEDDEIDNNLGSVLVFYQHTIIMLISLLEKWQQVARKSITLPDPILMDGVRVFFRYPSLPMLPR